MISVVMATYNGERFIVEQMESIRKQSLLPDEVLIFDDGSKDKTVEIVEKYICDNQLKSWNIIKSKENKGYSSNFSDAMKAASGDIIFLSDQDDIWLDNKIENMVAIMNKMPEISLLASNVKPFYIGEDPRHVSYERFKSNNEVIKINKLAKWIKPARPGCSMCFRKKLLQEYDRIWFDKYPHDCLIWGLAVLSGAAYLYNKDTILFRRHDNNASSRVDHINKNRVLSLQREIAIIEKMLTYIQTKSVDNKISKTINNQYLLYKKRLKAIKGHNVLSILGLFPYLKYYARGRYWLTDIYYCLKQ